MRLGVFFSAVLLGCALFLSPSAARAEEPRLTGTHGDWSTYVFIENGNKVCYMASQPKKAEGKYSQRGDVYALITHRPAEGSKNVFSYIAGYSYKAGSGVELSIDGQDFGLFTQDDTAWTPDAGTDNKLTQAIQGGSSMVVKGTSSRGTATKDSFSLKGSGAAYAEISQECGF